MGQPQNNKPFFLLLPYFLIGLGIGSALLILLKGFHINNNYPYLFFITFGILITTAYHKQSNYRLLLSSLLVASIASIPLYTSFSMLYNVDNFLLASWVTFYLLCNFHQTWHENNRFTIDYSTLFINTWNNVAISGLVICFTAGCWIILVLCAFAFDAIQIHFFKNLFFNEAFFSFMTPIMMNSGFAIGKVYYKIISSFTTILLQICRCLLPPLACISLAFLISFAIVTLYQGKPISLNHPSTLSLIIYIGIILINGVYKPTLTEKPYPVILGFLVYLFILSLPILCLLTLHQSLLLNSNANILIFGNTRQSYPVLVQNFILSVICVTYCINALIRYRQHNPITPHHHIYLGFFFCAAIIGSNNFWINTNVFKSAIKQKTIQPLSLTTIMKQADVTWSALYQDITPNKFIRAGLVNNLPILICRTKIENHWALGELKHNRCQIADSKSVNSYNNFEVLIGNSNNIKWTRYEYNLTEYYPANINDEQTIYSGFHPPTDNVICRGINGDNIALGRMSKSRCTAVSVPGNPEMLSSQILYYHYMKSP